MFLGDALGGGLATGAGMNHGMVAAGITRLMIDVGVQRYGVARSELLEAAGLDRRDLRGPNAFVPVSSLFDLVRFLLVRTGDPALGFRVADAVDLRMQGLWGYALLSSLTMR